MPTYRDEAVVLRTHQLGEADRIITMLGKQRGQDPCGREGGAPHLEPFGSHVEPFMVVDLQCYEGRSLDVIQQAESLGAYGSPIAADYASFTAANVIVETADRLTDEASPQQYLLLVGALRALARGDHGASLVLDSYLLRALSIAGWAPTFGDCAVTGPRTAHGVRRAARRRRRRRRRAARCAAADPATIELLGALLSGDWAVADAAGTLDPRPGVRRHRRVRAVAPGARAEVPAPPRPRGHRLMTVFADPQFLRRSAVPAPTRRLRTPSTGVSRGFLRIRERAR